LNRLLQFGFSKESRGPEVQMRGPLKLLLAREFGSYYVQLSLEAPRKGRADHSFLVGAMMWLGITAQQKPSRSLPSPKSSAYACVLAQFIHPLPSAAQSRRHQGQADKRRGVKGEGHLHAIGQALPVPRIRHRDGDGGRPHHTRTGQTRGKVRRANRWPIDQLRAPQTGASIASSARRKPKPPTPSYHFPRATCGARPAPAQLYPRAPQSPSPAQPPAAAADVPHA
jgi:hypothetical protein